MVPAQQTSPSQIVRSPDGTVLSSVAATWVRRLQGLIFFFLILFAILLPHSIKGARHAWMAAGFLWLAKLAIERKRPFRQALSAPLLAYILLSGISTALSPDPYLSWPRMRVVCLVLAGIVVAQNLQRLSQVRLLVWLLLLSALAAAAFTAGQYTYGVGVQIKHMSAATDLHRAGLHTHGIITHINGRSVHTPQQLARVVEQSPPGSMLRLEYLEGEPFHKRQTFLTREQFIKSGLGTQALQLARGKPVRAQGTLGHYIVFAEMLMQLGCLAWAMLLSSQPRKWGMRAFFAIIFLALTAALMATQTRADIAGLAAGCVIALWLLARKSTRIWAFAGLVVLLFIATLWIHHTRRLDWISPGDSGTHFRVMMWEDGVRLIRQHPWFGVGLDTIFNHWQQWNIRAFSRYHVIYHFHSDYIQIAVERGLLTLAAWLWFVVAYLVFLFRLLRRTREHSRFAMGVVAGVL
ncbi:MAG: O-antigen ligase family protein, partial [Candidatus Korobacteraceae bacterium]